VGDLLRFWTPRRASWFIVEIQYREPSYEARHGRRATPYRFRYRIEATSSAEAREHAVIEFARVSAMSSVGWTREIVGMSICRAADHEEA